jgi:hypothetical protein
MLVKQNSIFSAIYLLPASFRLRKLVGEIDSAVLLSGALLDVALTSNLTLKYLIWN